MTRDINQLLKIAEKFDKSGLFGSSEAVDGLIKHLAGKLTNDQYRAITKKIRNTSAKKVEMKTANDAMPQKLLAIAAQFDAEGNFEEADKIIATIQTMLRKKVSRAGDSSDLIGTEPTDDLVLNREEMISEDEVRSVLGDKLFEKLFSKERREGWDERQESIFGSTECICGSGVSPEECCG